MGSWSSLTTTASQHQHLKSSGLKHLASEVKHISPHALYTICPIQPIRSCIVEFVSGIQNIKLHFSFFPQVNVMAPTCPPRGIYAPVVAFFFEDETLDIETLKVHVTRLAEAGVAGLVIQGSNGEAPHLLHSERKEVISTAAAVLKEKGRPDAVIIAGCGAQSTRETIQLCQEAHESGAHYALVLSPSYWGESTVF